jgi:hypothetical protein
MDYPEADASIDHIKYYDPPTIDIYDYLRINHFK